MKNSRSNPTTKTVWIGSTYTLWENFQTKDPFGHVYLKVKMINSCNRQELPLLWNFLVHQKVIVFLEELAMFCRDYIRRSDTQITPQGDLGFVGGLYSLFNPRVQALVHSQTPLNYQIHISFSSISQTLNHICKFLNFQMRTTFTVVRYHGFSSWEAQKNNNTWAPRANLNGWSVWKGSLRYCHIFLHMPETE